MGARAHRSRKVPSESVHACSTAFAGTSARGALACRFVQLQLRMHDRLHTHKSVHASGSVRERAVCACAWLSKYICFRVAPGCAFEQIASASVP
eukprot:6177536-Pleurochrysis_carterae.AAC.4